MSMTKIMNIAFTESFVFRQIYNNKINKNFKIVFKKVIMIKMFMQIL